MTTEPRHLVGLAAMTLVAIVVLVFGWWPEAPAGAEGEEPVIEFWEEPAPRNLDSFLIVSFADTCYEYRYTYRYDYDKGGTRPCPEGYGPVTVNTPTSDSKTGCKESFGAVFDCGKIVEEADE